jgi:predicted Zn-dependent protease
MQVRTYLGFLLGVLVVVAASFWASLNRELLQDRFSLTPESSVPVYAFLLLVFLAGFLPSVTMLLVRSLKRDLRVRRQRRRTREAENLDLRLRRAFDHHADGQWPKAAAELEVVLTERPQEFAALLLYGEALRQQGKVEESLDVHRRASVLYPRSIALLYQLVEDYEALGDDQVAREIRNRILRDFPGQGLAVMRRRRDRALAGRGWEEALRWHERVESVLREAGDERSLEREAKVSLGLTYQRAVTLLEKDRATEAAPIFRKLLEEEPRFVPAGIMLGEAELLQDNENQALDEWKRGFMSTGSPVFLQRIEDHFIEAAQPARAIETLRSLIARTDNDLLLRFFLGRLYYRLEMHDEALKVLESIGERMDSSPTYHYLIARIHQRGGDARGAVASFLGCLQRLGVPNAAFLCRTCAAKYDEWQDRCSACGSWNSVDLDVQEEQLSEEELGVVERPVWGGYLDDTQALEIQAEK